MITQVSDDYSFANSNVVDFCKSKVSLLDKYILLQDGNNHWTLLLKKPSGGVESYAISTKSSTGYNYSVNHSSSSSFDYRVNNEFYVYSNVGVGKSFTSLPVHEGATCFSLVFIACCLSLAIFFKGVLFKCVRK